MSRPSFPTPTEARLPTLAFIHSPLVGPSSLAPTARRAGDVGHRTVLPDLTPFADEEPPTWDGFVGLAVRSLADVGHSMVVVAHSGAGAVAPRIAAEVPEAETIVFVDAVIPPAGGSFAPSPGLQTLLDANTTDGRLTPWPEWWPADVLERIAPDVDQRSVLRSEAPSLPRALYRQRIPMPDGWRRMACSYLRLSAAYDPEEAEAQSMGWPTERIDGTHLWTMTHPNEVMKSIRRLLDG